MTADDIIKRLCLTPHPEGGHFRETFRDAREVAGRAASTAIYFLLRTGEISRWHTVDAVEIWHYYAGDPLEIVVAQSGQPRRIANLGPNLAAGQQPQVIVPAGAWQMARPLGAYTLVGCTVAPGFDFEGFVLAPAGFEP